MSDLGASLQAILSFVKARSITFTTVEVRYSQTAPLETPIIVNLPRNGIRLRFDGAEQRLRCIEVTEFSRSNITYKGTKLGKTQDSETASAGPPFRRLYQILGATFPGEYVAPPKGEYLGTYVLSWPGVAFSFPIQQSAWSPTKDHVSLLGSQAAGPALHMVLFEGKSWPEMCAKLFVYEPTSPRHLGIAGELSPADVEYASLAVTGDVLLHRKLPAGDFLIRLNETTPQDLISELGPPDATYDRSTNATAASSSSHKRTDSLSKPSNRRPQSGSTPSSYSSTATDTYETDFDSDFRDEIPADENGHQTFWCYFSHGMDILVAPPSRHTNGSASRVMSGLSPKRVVTKVVLHGNVPGTYAFNRHRRLRWELILPKAVLNSESLFEEHLRPALLQHFSSMSSTSDMLRGKVVNRSWGSSSDDTAFFLPDADADLVEGDGSEQWLGNTRLYHFPGLVFEVAENGSVTTVTVY